MQRQITQARVVVAALFLLAMAAPPTAAHGPDPQLGTSGRLWAQDQNVAYTWASGAIPPAWMATSIDTGAADAGASRRARAATFSRVAGAASKVAYGGSHPCYSYAIACMDRSGVPTSFALWFRPHGTWLDWGKLRWCQAPDAMVDGCYDAENIALDELGHVEILGHHVNNSTASDFLDAVVQASPRTRPKTGWNEHVFGRCDVARLQLEYRLRNAADKLSTCLQLTSLLTLSASSTSISIGTSVRFAARLSVAPLAAARNLAGDPLSSRAVALQRRVVGSSTWMTVVTMAAGSTAGSYTAATSPTATYEWRARFLPSSDGALASASTAIRVSVSGCPPSGCPVRAPAGTLR
ncbi:MAG TPA: hypothetical protein VEX41_02785 [Candidatus Eisenbacteria bacterium]|nr:hypothetical protein [Candidatus Eisenbacteria bacterium]